MRRWHEDTPLLRRRVKDVRLYYHLDRDRVGGYSFDYYRWRDTQLQLGRWRKHKPLDCGRAKCGFCHGDKFYSRKARATKRRQAIEFDLNA